MACTPHIVVLIAVPPCTGALQVSGKESAICASCADVCLHCDEESANGAPCGVQGRGKRLEMATWHEIRHVVRDLRKYGFDSFFAGCGFERKRR